MSTEKNTSEHEFERDSSEVHTTRTASLGSCTESGPSEDFQARATKFLGEHAAMFGRVMQQELRAVPTPTLHNYQGEEQYKYAEPEALEFHLGVSRSVRERRLFELIKLGDVMEGHVTSKEFKELVIHVTSFVGSHKFRELADIDIQGRVSYDNLSENGKERDKIFQEMQVRDVVQGVMVGHHGNVLNLSFRESHAQELIASNSLPVGAQLGYRSGKVPRSAKRKGDSDDFLRHLEDDPGFTNPSCTDNLKAILGIGPGTSGTEPLDPGTRPTLFADLQSVEYCHGDYHQPLRKAQRAKWSMDSVAAGVKYFKEGEHNKAMKVLTHALDIDPQNVEGLVARGALYANAGKFKEGIRDFESALSIRHTHKNARKYLVETQVAYGEQLEESGEMEEAMRCYREALADDPQQSSAKERLQALTAFAEKKVAEHREKERKKLEDEKTLRKIQKLLDKEKTKKAKKSYKSKVVKKNKVKKRALTKPSRSRSHRDKKRYSSSDSESTISDSGSSKSSYSSSESISSSSYQGRSHTSRRQSPSRSRAKKHSRLYNSSSSESSPVHKRRSSSSQRKRMLQKDEHSPHNRSISSPKKRSMDSHRSNQSTPSTGSPAHKRRSPSPHSEHTSDKYTLPHNRSPHKKRKRSSDSYQSSRSEKRPSLDSSSDFRDSRRVKH